MWLNLAAGVLHFPTTQRPTDSINHRLALLRDALATLTSYRDACMAAAPGPKWKNHTGRPSMVFVAPEYMFLREGYEHPQNLTQLNQNRFLEATDHQRIVEALKAISAGYGKQLVFVPGTIASRNPIPDDPGGAGQAIRSAKAKVVSGADYIQGQLSGYDPAQRLNRGEAGPLLGKGALSPMVKLFQLGNMLLMNSEGKKCYLASNVAYMFHDGRLVGVYYKRADFHEVLPQYAQEDTVYVPGIKPGRATVGGINFGIEVCLDHVYGVLHQAPTVTRDLPRIHLVCSAAVEFKTANILVREGGYIMCASSAAQWTYIRRWLGGYQIPETPAWAPIGAGYLDMGVIELDILGF
jgi:predicted amidohydrolase